MLERKASAEFGEVNPGVRQGRVIRGDFKQGLEQLWSSLRMGRDPTRIGNPFLGMSQARLDRAWSSLG